MGVKNVRDLCRGISDFKKGYQPRTNIINDEKGDLFIQTATVFWLGGGTIYLSSSMYVHGVSDFRHVEIHTAEPLMPEPSAFEVELSIEKLKSHKSPGTDQIPSALIKTGCRTIHY